MTYQEIKFEQKEQVAWITLNRPHKMNALTPLMLQEWLQVLKSIATNPNIRAVVVTGAGKAWSAGVDLSLFESIKVEPGFDMYEDGMKIMELLETMPQVSIAMLNGYCFTGALEILMAFDLIVAAEEAKLGDTHTKWGIRPTWGMTQRLQQQIGLRKAKELSFTARTFTGKEAAESGLVNRAVPLESLKNTVDILINQILPNSAQTISAVKELYHYGSKHTLSDGLDFEKNFQVELLDKKDNLKNFKKEI